MTCHSSEGIPNNRCKSNRCKRSSMISLDMLSPSAYAKQLRNPEGDLGIAVARHISAFNRAAYETAINDLALKANCSVLEIGCSNGEAAPLVITRANDIRYTGIDISPTMVEEASRENASLMAQGKASFVLASSRDLPFSSRSFDRAFSIGVIHFWSDPATDLMELVRVLRPNATLWLGCLAPIEPPSFATPENGFYLRSANQWEKLCFSSGVSRCAAQTIVHQYQDANGKQRQLHTITIHARV